MTNMLQGHRRAIQSVEQIMIPSCTATYRCSGGLGPRFRVKSFWGLHTSSRWLFPVSGGTEDVQSRSS